MDIQLERAEGEKPTKKKEIDSKTFHMKNEIKNYKKYHRIFIPRRFINVFGVSK